MHLTPKEHPEAGHFYRSDHFSLAKAGVPAVSIEAGLDFVGRPKEWGLQQVDDYDAHRYHQPSDEYRPDFDLTGAVQMTDSSTGSRAGSPTRRRCRRGTPTRSSAAPSPPQP